MKRRRHHDDYWPFAAVSKGSHHRDAERDKGLSHSYLICEHNAGLVRQSAQNFRDRSMLPKGVVLADAIVFEVETRPEIAYIDGPSHASSS
jgi:hypothetical protein